VKSYRVLHVDDDALMRDVVEISLGLDPTFTLMSCASGAEALAMALDWAPELILCDVLMPDMDGPAVLASLRASKNTAKIPVVFMTASPQPDDVARWIALGAAAVIAKPFDPATFADTVREQLRRIKMTTAGYDFSDRLRTDAALLGAFRARLRDGADPSLVPDGLQSCVHKLAGAAGVFNFQAISRSATALEEVIIARGGGRGSADAVAANLDALLECIERE
jgi:two-component system OmpR family response regulator